MHTELFCENVKGRNHLGDLGIDGSIKLKQPQINGMWIGLIWLRLGSNGGLLSTQ
jgi:hypothetical protein